MHFICFYIKISKGIYNNDVYLERKNVFAAGVNEGRHRQLSAGGCAQDWFRWFTFGGVCPSKSFPPQFKSKGYTRGLGFVVSFVVVVVLFFSFLVRLCGVFVVFFFFSNFFVCFLAMMSDCSSRPKSKKGVPPSIYLFVAMGRRGSGHPERRSFRRPERDFLISPGSVWPRKTITHKEQVQCMVELRL